MNITQISVQYRDVKEILDAALANGGGTFRCPTYGKAVRFRQRAYAFRKAFREASPAASPYELLTIRKLPPRSEGPINVSIEVIIIEGSFIPSGNTPVAIPTPPSEAAYDEELLDVAMEVRKRLDLD